MLGVDSQGSFKLAACCQPVRKLIQAGKVVVHHQELAGKGLRLFRLRQRQTRAQQAGKALAAGVNVRNALQMTNCSGMVPGFHGDLGPQQQCVRVPRRQGQYPGESLVRALGRTPLLQGLGRAEEDFLGFVLLAHAYVKVGQARLHGDVFGIEFQHFLEDRDGGIQVVGLGVMFRNQEILLARITEQILLGIEFGQAADFVYAGGIDLGDFLVQRDRFDSESFRGVGFPDFLEVRCRPVWISHSRIQVAQGIQNGQVLGVVLQDLFVVINCVLNFPLLDVLLRRVEDLCFIKTKTERHTTPTPCNRAISDFAASAPHSVSSTACPAF